MIVVDTNILAYLWLPSTRHADATALGQVDPAWAAPLLWRSEFRNVTTGYLRVGKLSRVDAEAATALAAKSLLAGVHPVADSVVYQLAQQSKCTAYDCEFVALAIHLRTKLVTEDAALLRAFPAICLSLSQAVLGRRT